MYALVVCVGYSFVSYLFNSWLALQSFLFQKFSSLTLTVKELELVATKFSAVIMSGATSVEIPLRESDEVNIPSLTKHHFLLVPPGD